jgi:hypothetical protein
MIRNGLVFRVIGVLLLVGLMVAGGFMAYQAGIARGVTQAPVVAAAMEQAAESGQAAPLPPMYAYGHGYGPGFYSYHHPGFFPFSICGSILFVFFFFGLLRMLFFRPWHAGWGGHKHGPWGRHWENGVPPMFEEWHKRAHGEAASSESGSSKTDA